MPQHLGHKESSGLFLVGVVSGGSCNAMNTKLWLKRPVEVGNGSRIGTARQSVRQTMNLSGRDGEIE